VWYSEELLVLNEDFLGESWGYVLTVREEPRLFSKEF
jgi:hypothetical protein